MNKYIVLLLKSSMYNTIPPLLQITPDWDYIFLKAREQNITGLLYNSIIRMDKDRQPSDEVLSAFKSEMLTTVVASSGKYAEFLAVNNLMREKNITFIGLKGCVLRNLYSVPELRTMGDFDILTREADLPKLKKIFSERGYEIENDAYGIICKKGIVYWEIFTTIAEEFAINPEKWDKLYFSEITEMYGITCPAPTYFFLHLIIHTGKHLVGSADGIRNY